MPPVMSKFIIMSFSFEPHGQLLVEQVKASLVLSVARIIPLELGVIYVFENVTTTPYCPNQKGEMNKL